MKRAAAVVASLVVALLLLEGVLRLAWHSPYREESPDPILVLRLHNPRTHHVFDRAVIDRERPKVDLRTDERSYILPSRRYEDPDFTILFLGGSTTECEVVREELRFPALVGELLGERGYRVNTLNGAYAGNTTHDSLNVLLNHALADHPDVVVMMHAANDFGILSNANDYATRMARTMTFGDAFRWAAQIGSSRSHLLALLRERANTPPFDRIRRAKPDGRADVVERVAAGYLARLRAFVALSRAFGIEPVLMTQPLADFRTEFTPTWVDPSIQPTLNDFIRRIAEESDVPVVDLVRFLEREVPGWEEPMHVFYDGMHVTDEGSRLYAAHIAERLATDVLPRLVERRAGEAGSATAGRPLAVASAPGRGALSPNDRTGASPGGSERHR